MVAFLMAVVGALRAALRSRVLSRPATRSLVAENLALRQQLAIQRRQTKRARLMPLDRAFWIVLSWQCHSLPSAVLPTILVPHQRLSPQRPLNRS